MKKDKQNEKMEKNYENIEIVKLPKSEIEIIGAVPTAIFGTYRERALKNINNAVTIDGFRKGFVPEKVLLAKVGEKNILEEMAELALSDVYPAIVMDHSIDPVGRPEIRIIKMASGNPLEFRIKTAIIPEVIIGDYKKIARETVDGKTKKEKNDEISEKEIDDALARIKKSHETDGHDHTGHDHSNFETPEFREKIKSALVDNKRMEAVEKRRIAMADAIVAASTVDMPTILTQNETNRIEMQFKEDISRMGVTLDEYLKHAEKTLEELRKEWAPHAEKKAKLQLVLNKITEIEKIRAEEKEIEAEVAHILDHYKDADRDRAYTYAAGVLTNEKVFQFLESIAGQA